MMLSSMLALPAISLTSILRGAKRFPSCSNSQNITEVVPTPTVDLATAVTEATAMAAAAEAVATVVVVVEAATLAAVLRTEAAEVVETATVAVDLIDDKN